MKNATRFVVLLGLLLVPLFGYAQEKEKDKKETTDNIQTIRGHVEFGGRGLFGEVFGRPDLPFDPKLRDSKLNEYRDIRDGFIVPKAHVEIDDFLGTRTYLHLQTQKAIYKDQSYLATFGRWGRYKVSLRYDQIPHVFSN